MNYDTIPIKLGWDDPSDELLSKMIDDINGQHLSVYAKLSEPRIDGKYLYLKYEYCDVNWRSCQYYISGMIHGYLMANGIEII